MITNLLFFKRSGFIRKALTFLFLASFLLVDTTVFGQAEQQTLWEAEQRMLQVQAMGGLNNFCGTNLQPENNRPAEDIDINHRFSQFRGNGTWNLNDGYGADCDKDCDLTTMDRTAQSCSVSGTDIFKVPVVYTLNTTAGCPTSQPSQAELDAQITIMNDFMICQGIPMEFYQSQATRLIDVGCTYSAGNVTNVPNVVNIYVFSNTGNGTGCNGFAFLPSSTSSPTTAVMSYGCYNGFTYTPGTLDCNNPSLGSSVVLIHEMGHYFGLYHTHETSAGGGSCDDPTTADDDCTDGDLIADTDADPDYSGDEIGCTGCNTGGAVPNCSFDNTLPNCGAYGTPNTLDNVMSYNNFGGCRTNFSECQKAKMIDALLCARGPQMCDRDVMAEFANGTADTNVDICIGDAAPTFTATSDCYNWYDGLGGTANMVAGNTTTFTPTVGTGIGELNVNVIGTYTWYLGDLNEVNSNCRTPIIVNVLASPGSGSGNGMSSVQVASCSGPPMINLSSDVTSLGTDEVIGWWITENDPIATTVTNSATLSNTLGMATINGALSNPVNHLFESTTGTPINEYSLAFDCSNLNTGLTYYATPVVAQSRAEVSDVNCSVNAGATSSITFNGFPGKFNRIAPGDVCRPSSVLNPPTYNYCVTVSGYTGNPANLSVVIREDNFNGSNLYVQFFINGGNGTYCYTEADMSNANYDPGDPSLSSGMTVIFWEQGGNGMQNASLSTTLDITYPGQSAIPFPSLGAYNDCMFGSPVTMTASTLPIELSHFSGRIDNKVNVLEWTTATESNSRSFVIERSATGRSAWTKVGEVAAAGQSNETLQYRMIDERPLPLAYYRLRSIDQNGLSELSNIVILERKGEGTISVYPVPASETVQLEYHSDTAGTSLLTITDVMGRVVHQSTQNTAEGLNTKTLPIGDFSAGVYFLTLEQNEERMTSKIVKE